MAAGSELPRPRALEVLEVLGVLDALEGSSCGGLSVGGSALAETGESSASARAVLKSPRIPLDQNMTVALAKKSNVPLSVTKKRRPMLLIVGR
jgi:hypothetical protein